MRHTPGPWWIDDDGFVAAGSGDNYKTVADPRCMEAINDAMMSEMDANTHLISAAPELLEALRRAVEHAATHDDYDWIGAAEKAIAKAEGR